MNFRSKTSLNEAKSGFSATLRNPWSVVIGCLLSLSTSSGAVVVFTLSMFIAPLAQEFQWSRTTISLGFSMMTLCLAITAPFAGRILDYFGVRRALLLIIPVFAALIASLSLLPNSIPIYLFLFGLAGAVGAFHSSIPYVKVVSEWFDAKRGIALGVMMSGVALGGVVLTQTARYLLEHHGWRSAFVGLGAAIFIVGFSAVLLLVREKVTKEEKENLKDALAQLPGATVPEALRDFRFWAILFFVFCVSMAVNGIAGSAVAILTSKGITTGAAASMIGVLAISSLLGRLLTGVLLDRVFAPIVAIQICALTLVGIAALSLGVGSLWASVGLFAVGFSLGAETDAIAYMLSRYFGLRSLGALFGVAVGVFSLAPAVGMPLLGMSFDQTQSYGTALAGFGVAVAVAGLSILRLGAYKYPALHH